MESEALYGYARCVDYLERITIEPDKRGGSPASAGCASPSTTCSTLASGMSEDEILADFPELEREDIRACLAFAADRERKLAAGG